MPDVDCAGGRLYELLRDGRFVLVTDAASAPGDRAAAVGGTTGADVVVAVRTGGADRGLPAAVLVRPDGYVAWAADRPVPADIDAAVARWCGRPAALPSR
jgi:hypothetical protein